MDAFSSAMAWLFTALALGSLLGLTPRFRARIYPENPNTLACAAAPVLFSLLAVACFAGLALPALGFVAVAGLALMAVTRTRQKQIAPLAIVPVASDVRAFPSAPLEDEKIVRNSRS